MIDKQKGTLPINFTMIDIENYFKKKSTIYKKYSVKDPKSFLQAEDPEEFLNILNGKNVDDEVFNYIQNVVMRIYHDLIYEGTLCNKNITEMACESNYWEENRAILRVEILAAINRVGHIFAEFKVIK